MCIYFWFLLLLRQLMKVIISSRTIDIIDIYYFYAISLVSTRKWFKMLLQFYRRDQWYTQWNSFSFFTKKFARLFNFQLVLVCGVKYIYTFNSFLFTLCCFSRAHEELKMLLILQANNGKYVCITRLYY